MQPNFGVDFNTCHHHMKLEQNPMWTKLQKSYFFGKLFEFVFPPFIWCKVGSKNRRPLHFGPAKPSPFLTKLEAKQLNNHVSEACMCCPFFLSNRFDYSCKDSPILLHTHFTWNSNSKIFSLQFFLSIPSPLFQPLSCFLSILKHLIKNGGTQTKHKIVIHSKILRPVSRPTVISISFFFLKSLRLRLDWWNTMECSKLEHYYYIPFRSISLYSINPKGLKFNSL
jgi:hypothetical protein